jgi:hypothetical protein
MKPKYVDNRYPHGYVRSEATDISKTFERIRKEQKKQAEALSHKIISIQRKKSA